MISCPLISIFSLLRAAFFLRAMIGQCGKFGPKYLQTLPPTSAAVHCGYRVDSGCDTVKPLKCLDTDPNCSRVKDHWQPCGWTTPDIRLQVDHIFSSDLSHLPLSVWSEVVWEGWGWLGSNNACVSLSANRLYPTNRQLPKGPCLACDLASRLDHTKGEIKGHY